MSPRLLLPLLLACTALFAQTANEPAQRQEREEGRKNQRVEFIRIEDGGAIIDEVRYAGQTRSVIVQPKANMPQYELQPADMARSRPADNRDGLSSAGGQRVWNLFRF